MSGDTQKVTQLNGSYGDSSHKEIQALIHCLHSEVCSYVCANLKHCFCIDCYAYYGCIYEV